MDLNSFVENIRNRRQERLDFSAPMSDLNLDYDMAEGSYVLGANVPNHDNIRLNLNHNAKRQVCDKLGIPAKYFDYLEKAGYRDLALHNINELFQHGEGSNMVRSRNGNMTAFLSNRFGIYDNDFVAESVIKALSDDINSENVKVIDASETDKKLYMKVTKPSIKSEIAKGDVVEAGLIISNSETGHGAINVNPFINRLICLNGMTTNEARFKKVHLTHAHNDGIINIYSDETRLLDLKLTRSKLIDCVKESLTQKVFDSHVAKITDASKEIIKPTEAIEVITDKFQLSEEESKSIYDALVVRDTVDTGEPSKWSLINAVTNTAKGIKDIDRRQELEAYSGKILVFPMPKKARAL